ncbi:MAG TPA: nitroreductase [Acidimicrobiales bacterium]|nr:nitroreductase [Acidimicrobiales bacterium]
MDAVDAILARRSVGRLTEPAPAGNDLDLILRAAAAAPDHGELRPFRFVVLAAEAKDAFGQVLADAYVARCEASGSTPTPGQLAKERTKLGRAPLVVVMGAVHRDSDTIPWDEQVAAVAAATENALIAATALGYGSMWRTGDVAYDRRVKSALGFGPHDAIVAFVYLGTPHDGRARPARRTDVDDLVTWWQPPPAG